jgi:hypothetical protein
LNPVPNHEEYTDGIPNWLSLSKENDFDEDFAAMESLKSNEGRRWKWQPPLLAIHHHCNQLKQVILICSNANTSSGFVHHFKNICRRYGKLKNVEFQVYRRMAPHLSDVPSGGMPVNDGVRFDSFEQLSSAVWYIIRHLKRRNVKESDIVIDFTGGNKVVSAVAAATTFNRRIHAQYVNTETMQVTGYDMLFSSTGVDKDELL